MMKLTKKFKWAMAHLLENHNGLCANVHGHNYKLFVTVGYDYTNGEIQELKGSSNEGMICDFKYLKDVVNNVIIDKLDHAFVYNQNDKVSCELADFMVAKIRQKVCSFDFRLTAENIAKWIYEEINKKLDEYSEPFSCNKVVLYETDNSFVEYSEK